MAVSRLGGRAAIALQARMRAMDLSASWSAEKLAWILDLFLLEAVLAFLWARILGSEAVLLSMPGKGQPRLNAVA